MRLGVFDIGTNSVHMVLVDIKKDLSIEVVDRAKEFVRLGDSAFNGGSLSKESISRTLTVIQRFKKLAEIQGAQKIIAVATSAVREAKNGGQLVNLIQKKTGIRAKVITGTEEARLIDCGVRHSVAMGKEPYLIVDIGGGSVELIVSDEDGIKEAFSLKLGAARVKALFVKHDPLTEKEINRIQKYVSEELKEVTKRLKAYPLTTLVGTSGTIANVMGACQFRREAQPPLASLNNLKIRSKDIVEFARGLSALTARERSKIRGIDPQRLDLIVPGALVFARILEEVGLSEVTYCDAAIREGIVYDYIERNRNKIKLAEIIPDLRLRSVVQLARKYGFDQTHSEHVAHLALSLFDQTKTLHRLGIMEREYLHYAALLHDVGYHINVRKHHKHTYYLVKNGHLRGFEAQEIEIIANMARYHSGSVPKKSHSNTEWLKGRDLSAVEACGSMLRLAEGLDRSHFGVVKNVRVRKKGKNLILELQTKGDPELEVWSAQQKADLFEKRFKKKLQFRYRNKPREKTK